MRVTKMAFFECDQPRVDWFRSHISDFELKMYPEHLSPEHLSEIMDCQILFVSNYSQVTREIIKQLKELKFITVGATGYNNIDIQACEEQGIIVSNAPGYSVDTIAEYAIMLMLMITRHAHSGFLRARDNKFAWNGLVGQTSQGKTLGIIGTGKIGLKVIELAKGFGMKVIAYDIYKNHEKAAELDFTYASLEDVLAGSDIVSLHLTANKDTHYFINQKTINLFKKGSFLINTSRGEVLDTKALVWALDHGIVRGAALDVLEEEKLCQDNRLAEPDITPEMLERYALNQHLLHREDVLITPHIGWYTKEAIQNMNDINLTNILSFMEGAPKNVVTAGTQQGL